MLVKMGREISAANAETIRKAHDHVMSAAKFIIKAHDHLVSDDTESARKFIIKAHRLHKAALGHLRDLLHKTEEEEEEEEDYADEEARRRKEEDEDEDLVPSSTGLNPFSSAASEYDHMRSGLSVMSPQFHRIEKRIMGADRISVVGTPSAQTYLIDEQKFSEMMTHSLGTMVHDIAESAAVIAINRAKGRVD